MGNGGDVRTTQIRKEIFNRYTLLIYESNCEHVQPVGNILCTYNYYLFVVLNMINNVLGISKYTYNYVSLFFSGNWYLGK